MVGTLTWLSFVWAAANPAPFIGQSNLHEKFQLPGYSQGGTVVDGIAYFTADDATPDGYPNVAAFDARTGRKIRSYPFWNTYDSAPMVLRKKDGRKVVIAHEWALERTRALHADDGSQAWVSPANQPGSWFFGYSWYRNREGTSLILTESENGLHANSLDDGGEAWWIRREGGMTPAVDQGSSRIYFQSNGRLDKIDAENGNVLKSVQVDSPSHCQSANTILVKDEYGYYIVTYWFGHQYYGSAIRVFDQDLNLVWVKGGLPLWQKYVPTYHGGRLFLAGQGIGNGFFETHPYQDEGWKWIEALDIRNGKTLWKTEMTRHRYMSMTNLIHADGYLIGETQGFEKRNHYKVFILDAQRGKIRAQYDSRKYGTSCAPPLLHDGILFSGDMISDRVFATHVGLANHGADWPGPFGDPQLHHMSAAEKPRTIRPHTNGAAVGRRGDRLAGRRPSDFWEFPVLRQQDTQWIALDPLGRLDLTPSPLPIH